MAQAGGWLRKGWNLDVTGSRVRAVHGNSVLGEGPQTRQPRGACADAEPESPQLPV